jgi:hypothetical protein
MKSNALISVNGESNIVVRISAGNRLRIQVDRLLLPGRWAIGAEVEGTIRKMDISRMRRGILRKPRFLTGGRVSQ